jgi:DNA polymerase-3 subunit alpha (Gram-positive type)
MFASKVSLLLGLFAVGFGTFAVAKHDALPATNTPVAAVTFVLYDTETTGLSPRKERIIEIAATKFLGGKVLEEKAWLINPGRPIPPEAMAIHHITDADVRDKPDFKTVYPEFEQFIRGAVVMAHNAKFDVGFIREECVRNNLQPPSNLALDTLPMFRTWFPHLKRHDLDTLNTAFQIKQENRHRAQSDTADAVRIFWKGLKQQPDGFTFGELLRAAQRPLWFTAP